MKLVKSIALAFFALACTGAAAKADILVGSYVAYISEGDKYNSNGQRLTSPAAILRQDRANYHAFGRGDALDQGDCFFGSRANRAALESMLENGCASPGFAAALRYGNPLVHVAIYRTSSGRHYINVVLAH